MILIIGDIMHGGDIYNNKVKMDFSVNLNPLGVPESVKKAIIDSVENIANYPENGAYSLKRELSETLKVSPDSLLMTSGASEAFMSIVRALEPKRAMIFDPCFSGYEYVLNSKKTDIYHGRIEELEGSGQFLDSYNGSMCQASDEDRILPDGCESLYSLDDFINIHNSVKESYEPGNEILIGGSRQATNNSIVFFANPNNPNGKCIDTIKLKNIISTLSENGIYSVIDECFLPLTDRMDESFIGTDNPYVIVVRSFTKSFAIPGIRLGYTYTPDNELIKQISREIPEWNLSISAIAAGKACLKETGYLDRAREVIRTEGCRLRKSLNELGLKTYPTDTCYIMLAGPEYLYEKMLEEGVLIRDLSDYRGLGKGFYRVAVKTRSENGELLNIMKTAL